MTSIIARSGDVSAGIKPNRPSWKDMSKNYMGEDVSRETLYPMISAQLVRLYQENDKAWENTCAIRMSYALNRSGIKLPSETSPKGGTLKGDDGRYYWIRVRDLKKYLRDRFRDGDVEYELSPITHRSEMPKRAEQARENIIRKIQGRHGIIVFDVKGWDGATGHFTLWNGSDLVYVGDGYHNDDTTTAYYFWFAQFNEKEQVAVQTVKVTFWELK
ncbi:hypothetical protein BWR15_27880 [Pseudomonas sp. T]|nr:hypothetical protein BWR15_27880 [Pseudomonas sp. T]